MYKKRQLWNASVGTAFYRICTATNLYIVSQQWTSVYLHIAAVFNNENRLKFSVLFKIKLISCIVEE